MPRDGCRRRGSRRRTILECGGSIPLLPTNAWTAASSRRTPKQRRRHSAATLKSVVNPSNVTSTSTATKPGNQGIGRRRVLISTRGAVLA